jgi:hypothetical protein
MQEGWGIFSETWDSPERTLSSRELLTSFGNLVMTSSNSRFSLTGHRSLGLGVVNLLGQRRQRSSIEREIVAQIKPEYLTRPILDLKMSLFCYRRGGWF